MAGVGIGTSARLPILNSVSIRYREAQLTPRNITTMLWCAQKVNDRALGGWWEREIPQAVAAGVLDLVRREGRELPQRVSCGIFRVPSTYSTWSIYRIP